jgi:cell division protein FtsZ
MRVTVVATGLNSEYAIPTKVVDNTQKETSTDYRNLDRPAILRNRESAEPAPVMAQAAGAETDMDYLDIPAFLRRQAD